MRKLMMAGLMTGLMAGAMAAAPVAVVAKPVVAALSSNEQSQATRLAESIVRAVMAANAGARGLSEADTKVRIELAVQAVIRDSGATPVVADAALEMAMARLKAAGVLDCIHPKDKEQVCNAPGQALASISGLLKQIVSDAPAQAGHGGPIPIGDPAHLLGPNSGTSDYRGS